MTQHTVSSQQPAQFLPRHTTLQEWLIEATALWNHLNQTRPDLIKKGELLFGEYPGAQNDATDARTLVRQLRGLLELGMDHEPETINLPFPAVPTSLPAPQSADDVRAEAASGNENSGEHDGEGNNGDGNGDDDESETGEEDGSDEDAGDAEETGETASHAEDTSSGLVDAADVPSRHRPAAAQGASVEDSTQTPDTYEPPTWAPEDLGDGLVSSLAQTLKAGQMLQIVMVRQKNDTVRLSVQPGKVDGEIDGTCKGFTVNGTPRQLDAEMPSAMPSYQQARQTAGELAHSLNAEVTKTANAAKAAAAKAKDKAGQKSPPSTNAGKKPAVDASKGLLNLSVKTGGNMPTGKYVIELVGDVKANNIKQISTQQISKHEIAPGTYLLSVTQDKFKTFTQKLTFAAGETQVIEVDLTPADSLF